jgi:prepilin-type N-terminal cleavage/methylation domain-containing protein
MQKGKNGFTLIELLIVVVIIGILAAIASPKFGSVRDRAFMSAARADLRNLASQEEVYYNSNYTYSSDLTAIGFTNSEGITVTVAEASNTGWSASAVPLGLPGDACAIYHGDASPLTPATVVSSIQCTR